MEGGGNMKREGEGHREIERVSKEKRQERRGERVVLELSMRERERAEKREGESISGFFFQGESETAEKKEK